MTSRRKATRNILVFILLVNGLAWLGPLLGGGPTAPGPGLLVWGTAPLVAALIMRWGFRDQVHFGIRPAVKAHWHWYLVSLLGYPFAIGFVVTVGMLLGTTSLNDFTLAAFVAKMAQPIAIYLVFAIFEEVGWRGYLTPRVQEHNDGLLGYVLIGIVWASWHFPYMQELWAHTTESMVTFLPRFVLGTIIFAMVYGEIRRRTNSFWPAVLMHWVGNTLANTLLMGFVAFTPGTEWLTSFGVGGLLIMIMAALMGGVLYWRRGSGVVEVE